MDVPGSLPVPVTFNFHLTKKKKKAQGDSTRYENDELVIETQDLSLDGNVLEGSHKRSSFCKVKTPLATRIFQTQPAAVKDIEESRKQAPGGF